MDSLGRLLTDTRGSFLCELLSPVGLFPILNDLVSVCNVLTKYNLEYAGAIQAMMQTTSAEYGDPNFYNRLLTVEDRIKPLAQTDLLVTMTLAANSRYDGAASKSLWSEPPRVSYVGPSSSEEIFALPIAMHYAVKNSNQTFYKYAVEDNNLPLVTRTKAGARKFRFSDWEDFYLYNGDQTSSNVFASKDLSDVDPELFSEPFGGGIPTVGQISSASSGFLAFLASSVPSFLSQHYSVAEYDSSQLGFFLKLWWSFATMFAVRTIYRLFSPLKNIAICSQWPKTCGSTDGYLMDGIFSEMLSIAQTVGQYQTNDNGDLSKTMKVIVTLGNVAEDSYVGILSYFRNSITGKVQPGDSLWAPSTLPVGLPIGLSAQRSPWRSMQIFREYLDEERLDAQFSQVPGTTLTTATVVGTTLDNPVFGIKAGQKVEIFVVRANSPISGWVLFLSVLEQQKALLAELARDIAGNEELLARVNSFLEG